MARWDRRVAIVTVVLLASFVFVDAKKKSKKAKPAPQVFALLCLRCSNKVARKRLARRHSRNGPWTHECCFEVMCLYVGKVLRM